MTAAPHNPSCRNPNCGCKGGRGRREFLKLTGLGAAGLLAAGRGAMAGPFERADFDKLVPPDKKLTPEWIKSLYARGTRTVYRGAELEKIGMPVGGLCAGQLYLGGDGKLWHWDIFNNQDIHTGDGNYAHPPKPSAPLDQGFALRVKSGGKTQVQALDRSGFGDITFCGEYPIAFVEYRDAAVPVAVTLEAFSPFVPLNTEDSSLPVTVLRFTVKNTSNAKIEAELAGWLENAVGLNSKTACTRQNKIVKPAGATCLECSATELVQKAETSNRPDIVFDDFEKETYEGWTVTGTAFGDGPIEKAKMPDYQGDVGGHGKRVVNSHNARHGEDIPKGDAHVGTLTSKEFVIERNYITFLIGGGAHKGKTCMNLLVDGKAVDSATGKNDNRMQPGAFDVRAYAGKTAQLQIVDNESGPWGNIGIDYIVFSDKSAQSPLNLKEQPDFGTLALAVLEGQESDLASAGLPDGKLPETLFTDGSAGLRAGGDAGAPRPLGQKLCGAVGRKLALEPGQEAKVTFALAWHFPNLRLKDGGRHYATRFESATAAVEHLSQNLSTLSAQTRLWHDTWYDSTLPYWFLDRTFLNTSILATSTAHWFKSGRFYGWEGVGCCDGTCTHVWHYAHAVARLFPQWERDLRERTDYGLAFDPKSGIINHRGEGAGLAVDGQAGCILRAYREHQMSADDAFLKRVWPRVKKALEFLIQQDGNDDGILEGGQHNTLDTAWFGPVAWLSGLYHAALRAGEEMAREVGDEDFAKHARAIFEVGRKKIVEDLWNGEYFINKPDPKHPEAVNSGSGCEIDQVFGQSWAFQVNLGRVFDEEHARGALKALWKLNFSPDVGPYRAANKPGRWYAMPGEAGLLMCTFPRTDWDYDKAKGKGKGAWAAMYFNECMNGFEYQAAGHMLWEGLVQEGLAVTRAIHDRYHAARRNPWNEVECGDHYARSMASYGVFLAACGYEHHGPKGHLGFAPRLTPEDFRVAFTTAEGWGTFTQKREGQSQRETIELKSGKLRLKTLAFALPENAKPGKVAVTVAGNAVAAEHAVEDGRVLITLGTEANVQAGQAMEVTIG
ncbi:MAG: GH116 family glycosyl-hydrolase [Planctomycetota bacterium]